MRLGVVLAGLTILSGPGAAPADSPSAPALADRIVRHLALEPGERVLLLAHPTEFRDLLPPLRAAVMRARGLVLERTVGNAPTTPLPGFDAVLVLPAASAEHPDYRAAHAALTGPRRAVHFHWRGVGPTPSVIEVPGHPLPPAAVVDATYERAVLHTDCGRLGAAMRRFEAALRAGEARVTTPRGTDLRFSIGDRPVNVQDGDASAARALRARVRVDRDVELPCGVVRVAPLEHTVAGTIVFPPARWGGRPVEGLKMRFEKGRLLEMGAAEGLAAAEAELEAGGDAARAFREFALGFNPNLAVPRDAPWIPYYGYGAGVVRLSLGDNTELGGTVTGGYVRWNFFTDATVTVGGRVWVDAGSLVANGPK